jgi:hypothetical protein
MIELHITTTIKGYHPTNEWLNCNTTRESFPDLSAAKAWLKDRYGNCSRRPMYVGEGRKVGYIYGFRNDEHYRDGTHYKFIQQDWVAFRESKLFTP